MFTKELIQAISDWQRGGDAKQKRKRGEKLKIQAQSLPAQYKETTQPCFRQIALKGRNLMDLGNQYQIAETISSWTKSLDVAKDFKGGVPSPGDYVGIMFSITPTANMVILDLTSLFADSDFVLFLDQVKNEIVGYNDGIGRWKNTQEEVIIETSHLPLGSIHAWGGFSSPVERFA